jgi:hypothetical protein
VWIPKADANRWPTVTTVPPLPGVEGLIGELLYPNTNPYNVGQSRAIANSGDTAGYGQLPGALNRGMVYQRSAQNVFYCDPLGADLDTALIAVNNGTIGVGASGGPSIADPQHLGNGGVTRLGIMYHPAMGTTPIDLNAVTSGLGGYTIDLGVGISMFNSNGLNKMYIGAYASDGTTRKLFLLESSGYGDFNASGGSITVADINLLNAAINGGLNPPAFDLTGDGLVNAADRRMEVEGLLATRLGDTNLDNAVDIIDLGVIGTNWQQNPGTWAGGDFDGSGLVDIVDLGMVGSYWQFSNTVKPGADGMSFSEALKLVGLDGVMVPEPSSLSLLALGAIGLIRRRRS